MQLSYVYDLSRTAPKILAATRRTRRGDFLCVDLFHLPTSLAITMALLAFLQGDPEISSFRKTDSAD